MSWSDINAFCWVIPGLKLSYKNWKFKAPDSLDLMPENWRVEPRSNNKLLFSFNNVPTFEHTVQLCTIIGKKNSSVAWMLQLLIVVCKEVPMFYTNSPFQGLVGLKNFLLFSQATIYAYRYRWFVNAAYQNWRNCCTLYTVRWLRYNRVWVHSNTVKWPRVLCTVQKGHKKSQGVVFILQW